eukprot:g7339.t1
MTFYFKRILRTAIIGDARRVKYNNYPVKNKRKLSLFYLASRSNSSSNNKNINNTTTRASFQTLNDLYDKAVREFPDKNLIGTKNVNTNDFEWTTYKEFDELTQNLKMKLRQEGFKNGDKLAIISDNSKEWAITAYAGYALGMPVVPLYPNQLPGEWDYIINDSGAKIIFAQTSDVVSSLKNISSLQLLPIVNFENNDRNSNESFALWCDEKLDAIGNGGKNDTIGMDNSGESNNIITPQNIASLIYTSGTTGKPKGVMLTHENICSNISAVTDLFHEKIDSSTVTLSILPWAHVYGQTMELHNIINAGGSMGITNRDTIMEDIQKVKPTVLLTVPMMYNRIYDGVRAKLANNKMKEKLFNFGMKVARERREWFDEGKEGFAPLLFLKWNFVQKFIFSSVTNVLGGRIKFCCTGGGALSPIIQQWFGDIGIPMLEGYGLTETSPVVALERYGPTEKTQGGLQAVPGVEILIVKPNEVEELKNGEEGEICVVGNNIMKGYHKREDATDEVIYTRPDGSNDRVFRTGDLGILKDNVLKITGRASEQYKLTNGKFVVPGNVEDKFKLWSPFVQQCFVYGLNKEYNVLLIVPDFDSCAVELGIEKGEEIAAPEKYTKNESLKQLFRGEIDKLAKLGKLGKSYEVPRKFAIVNEPFSIENGLLTPKLSMKRNELAKRYSSLIE